MASVFTHAAAPLLMLCFLRKNSWKFILLSLLTATAPDLDVFLLKYFSYASIWGHRGFTHGIFFGFVWSLTLATVFFRKENKKRFAFVFIWFFFLHQTHSLMDAMTDGGLGVGFLTPFLPDRYFLPWRPLVVSPLDIGTFFGGWGLKVLLSEIALIVLPLIFLVLLYRYRKQWSLQRIATLTLIFIVEMSALYAINGLDSKGSVFRLESPKVVLRGIEEGQPAISPFHRFPERHYKEDVTSNFNELKAKGLIDTEVMVSEDKRGWGSPFFPNWYGGLAGRWQDSDMKLFMRTLFNFKTLKPLEALTLLEEQSEFLYRLSPAEKYDLAMGDYKFHATQDVLNNTHNRINAAKDYFGICNGVAFASINLTEPTHRVTVVNPDGYSVDFHPGDVKALLSMAYYSIERWKYISGGCGNAYDCSINPALFMLASLNNIGIHDRPLVIDLHPSYRAQFYPMIGLKTSLKKYLSDEEVKKKIHLMPKHEGHKVALVDFEIVMNSTIMSNHEVSSLKYDAKKKKYEKVGVREVRKNYQAYIGIGEDGEVLSGEWIGDGFSPDILAYSLNNYPKLISKNQLEAQKYLRWDVIEEIYVKSLIGGTVNISKYVDKGKKNYWVDVNNVCKEYDLSWKFIKKYNLNRQPASNEKIPEECFSGR